MDREPGDRSRHLTYANVASGLAIFLALAGGTALAVGAKKNSVTSAAVRNNSLRSVDLAKNAGVTGADVADGSLAGADLGRGAIGAAKIADGSIGGADLEPGSVTRRTIAAASVLAGSLNSKAIGTANVVDGSVGSDEVAADTVTARNIDLSSLQRVQRAFTLDGFVPATFFSSEREIAQTSPLSRGTDLGDGTFKLTQRCPHNGEILLAGGAVNLNPGSNVVESFPKENSFTVRINPHGVEDQFAVQTTCAGPAR